MKQKLNKKLILIGLLVAILLVFAFARQNSQQRNVTKTENEKPKIIVTEGTSNANMWNNIRPGYHKLADVENLFGSKATRGYIGEDITKYTYTYKDKTLPITVMADSQGTIKYINVYTFDAKGEMDKMIHELNLGTPDLALYVKGTEADERVYVFLSKGVAIQGNEFARDITTISYFVPTTKETFMRLYAQNLSEEPSKGHGY